MKTMMAQDGLTGEGIRKPSQAAAQTSPGYTDGYTDELTEAGQAAVGSAQTAAGQEEETGGIQLKFGE
jgi:hypothetical protein